MFQIGVVGGDHSFYLRFIQAVQQGFGDGSSQHRLRTRSEFIDQDQSIRICIADEIFHIDQVRAVCAEVVLDGLFVAYVDQYLFKDAEAACFAYRNGEAALEHILQQAGRLQAY